MGLALLRTLGYCMPGLQQVDQKVWYVISDASHVTFFSIAAVVGEVAKPSYAIS